MCRSAERFILTDSRCSSVVGRMDDSVFVRLVLFYQKRFQFVESANVAVSESALPFSILVTDHLNDFLFQ